jgi:hypothetical protein
MTTTTHPRQALRDGILTTAALLGLAAAVAVLANTLVAGAALTFGADPDFAPLSTGSYAPATVVGLLAAYLGWQLVRSRSRHPARLLRRLVPGLAVLSFAPDAVLLVTRFLPGTTAIGVLGLATMHVVALAVALPVCARLAPLAT